MPVPDMEPYEIEENLRKFYRHSQVMREETENGFLFRISRYEVRDTGKECTAALLVEGKEAFVLIDRNFEESGKYLSGNEGRREISGNTWVVVPENFFWDLRRPPYWFVERNLTSFFRNRALDRSA